ncbi:hypothetical protein KGA66_06135 [Actinocrinis puniceicyclus]|uniref:Uncharacterized protein n=1 Tax=Actinocrinis puniceicyclus TaxID=977794 RepID=A0A8J8BB08_9ACTN|nr:hypothetical protein [Actinocrinis puniceicyclus]MBS2962618.1 hypothetical protein [Actinocrinis puniceicyclus]
MQEESDPPARKDATPPPTDAERLWRRYQLPEGKTFPDDRLPLDRYHWNLLILRLGLPDHIKAIAGALATLGNADGSNMVTTDPRLLAAFNIKERQLRDRMAVLHQYKLLHVWERPGGRGVAKTIVKGKVRNAIVCQLTEPADGKLPYRLDADFLPIEPIDERKPGAAPVAAIEANRAARAENTGSDAAAAITADNHKHRQPQRRSNADTPAAPLPQQDQYTGSATAAVSDAETTKPRQPGYRSNGETPAAPLPEQAGNTGSSSAAVSALDAQNSGSQAAAATPVDNEKHRQPQRRSSPETPAAAVPKHRQSECRSNENSGTAAAAAASRVEELKNPSTKNPLNPTTRVVQLGGDLTSDVPDDAKSDSPAADPSQSAEPPPAFEPTDDPEYDDARTVVATVPLDELSDLLADAQGELEAELAAHAGTHDDGTTPRSDHRQILIRAAQIVLRTEPARPAPTSEGPAS